MCGTGTFQIHAREQKPGYADQGGASRFFPTFRHERDENGCVPGCAVAELDAQSGITTSSGGKGARSGKFGAGVGGYGHDGRAVGQNAGGLGDSGGASRYFPVFKYQAKAPSSERPKIDGKGWPTVKPLSLMRWIVRLVTPPGGLVLDPFAGTGTTLQAAELEGFDSLGVERDDFAYRLACQRLGIEARIGS